MKGNNYFNCLSESLGIYLYSVSNLLSKLPLAYSGGYCTYYYLVTDSYRIYNFYSLLLATGGKYPCHYPSGLLQHNFDVFVKTNVNITSTCLDLGLLKCLPVEILSLHDSFF